MSDIPTWLDVKQGTAPLIISFPHSGTEIPADIEGQLVSPWLARKDADWWIDRLYDFAGDLGATLVRTAISRTVIDVNRDPSGIALYPGQSTTELCPTITFDGEALYREGEGPSEEEIAGRRRIYFDPYHQVLADEIKRLQALHGTVALYEAHSIRSQIPRLFDGLLPIFNIGTNGGRSCDPDFVSSVERACDASGFSRVTDGRFKGGYTTRHYGRPDAGVQALQMELACRSYMDDPTDPPSPDTWPPPFEEARAAPMRSALRGVITACLSFVQTCPYQPSQANP